MAEGAGAAEQLAAPTLVLLLGLVLYKRPIQRRQALGMAISYLDLKGTLGGITLNQTGRELECMLLMMLIYLTLSLMISTVMNIYNRSVKLKER